MRILYRKHLEESWIDITENVYSESKELITFDNDINTKLFEFDLKIYNPQDSSLEPIYINTGDEIAITNNTYNAILGNGILAGKVEKIEFPLDKGLNENNIYEHNLLYTLRVQHHNFSNVDLSLFIDEILPLSTLLNDYILPETSLGGIKSDGTVINKCNITSDIDIEPLNFEGSNLDVLISLCNQVSYLFTSNYDCEYDSTNLINLFQYLNVFENSGSVATGSWSSGIDIQSIKNGAIFIDGELTKAEKSFKYSKDASTVKNSLLLNFLVKDTTNLERYDETSTGGKDIFYLGKAYDIKYVALYIDTTISNVISSTVLELPHAEIVKMRADQSRLDDNGLGGRMTALINDTDYINFNVDPSLDRVTLDSPLTLSNGDRFELVNCFDILQENLPEYPSDGNGYIVKHIKAGEDAYVKFTKYDMPRTATDIVIFFYPVNDAPIKEIFEESKKRHGLRTLRENLGDIFVSPAQSEQLFNEYKKLKDELEKLSFESSRVDILPIGSSVNVNIGDINKAFIATESKTSILKDANNSVIQNITLSSFVNNLASIIAKLRNENKLKEVKANVQERVTFRVVFENIVSIRQGVINGISAPVSLPATSITTDTFILNYDPVSGATTHKADLSLSPTFDSFISGWNNKTVGTTGYYLVNGLSSLSGPFYYRLRALDSSGNSSENSSVITVIKSTERILFMKPVASVLQVFSCKLDGSDIQQHTETTDIINDAVYLPNGDIIISKYNGSEYKLFRIKKDESYAVEYELLDDSDNPLSLNNNSVASSHNGLYLAYSKESPPVSSNLYEYNLITRVETQLTTGDPPFSYSPKYDSTDENIYHSSGTFASDLYINKYNRALSSNDILSTDSKSIFSAVDNDNNYLYYAQFSSYPALIIKKFDLDLNTSSDFITTGNTYFNNLFLDSANNYLYFANDRSPHSGQYKIYRSSLDGATQEILLGESDGENYLICDVKSVLSSALSNNLQIDSNTLIALDLGEGSGSVLNPTTPTTIEANISGDTSSIWQSSSISDYSLDLNGTDNYIYTDADNTPLTDFTFRTPFRFNTGDKLAKSLHILGAKYNTTGSNILGFIISLEFYSATNELILTINDESGSWGSFTYRQFTHIYDFNENQDYIVQASFKLDDPSNSNLNTAEICVNGTKLSSGTWTDSGISNISTIQNSNIPYTFGAYTGASGIPSLSQFKAHKFYFDTCFRSESFALQDAQNIGLA